MGKPCRRRPKPWRSRLKAPICRSEVLEKVAWLSRIVPQTTLNHHLSRSRSNSVALSMPNTTEFRGFGQRRPGAGQVRGHLQAHAPHPLDKFFE